MRLESFWVRFLKPFRTGRDPYSSQLHRALRVGHPFDEGRYSFPANVDLWSKVSWP